MWTLQEQPRAPPGWAAVQPLEGQYPWSRVISQAARNCHSCPCVGALLRKLQISPPLTPCHRSQCSVHVLVVWTRTVLCLHKERSQDQPGNSLGSYFVLGDPGIYVGLRKPAPARSAPLWLSLLRCTIKSCSCLHYEC